MTNTEKVAYIRGLAEGLELDESKKEVKVINAMLDLLDNMAASLAKVEEDCSDIADQLDSVDEDLADLEEEFYGGGHSCSCEDEDDDIDEDDETYYEVTCPTCHETICLSEATIADGEMECPNCGEKLEFDLDDDDDCSCCE